MHKLNQEDREALAELRQGEGIKPLLMEIENRVLVLEKEVLNVNLDGTNNHELIARKLRAEGARKLFNDLRQILEESANPTRSYRK